MKEFYVANANGLVKFTAGERVLVDNINDVNSLGEVKVYKMDADGDILVNSNGNKVSYSLVASRLRPVDEIPVDKPYDMLSEHRQSQVFTDDNLARGAMYRDILEAHANVCIDLKTKLNTIANNLLNKANELTSSANTVDEKAFSKVMGQMDAITKFLADKPMADIKALADKLIPALEDDDFDATTLLD